MSEKLKSKRILVIGSSGQVGRALINQLAGECDLVTAARSGADFDLDLTDSEQIAAILVSLKPNIVINAAAYTQVDNAEDNPELAQMINGQAPAVIAEQCKYLGALLVHYSTDYVFAGTGDRPLSEEDNASPISVYGHTKLEGERAIQAADCDHLIFRTCWVYDEQGKNFPNAILNAARTKPLLRVVDDQYGTPTSAEYIADITKQVISRNFTDQGELKFKGIYNLTARGYTTWYRFARHIIERAREHEELLATEIIPITTDLYPTRAKRPGWSVLDNNKIARDFNIEPLPWEQLFNSCLQNMYSSSHR